MPAEAVPNGLLCALMLLCAACVRGSDRRLALELAAVLTGVWVLYIAAWTDLAPARLIYRATNAIGWPQEVQPSDLWSATDCVAGMWLWKRALEGFRIWVVALFGLTIAQCACHVIHSGWPFATYSTALNWLFLAQVTVFLLLGGKGAVAHIADAARRMRSRASRAVAR